MINKTYIKGACLVLAVLMTAELGGCGFRLHSEGEEPDKKEISRMEKTEPIKLETITAALDSGDKALFKSLFSDRTVSICKELDRQIDYVFSIYEGKSADDYSGLLEEDGMYIDKGF